MKIVLCVAALLLCGVAHGADMRLLRIERNIIGYTNAQRVKRGLCPLVIDAALMKSARDHASWMTRRRRMVHTRLNVAENIAMGYTDSRDVVRGWMNSPGHRRNLLNGSHRKIGAAAFRRPGGSIYWCQQFK